MKARYLYSFFLCLLSFTVLSQIAAGQTKRSWMNPMGALADVEKGAFSSLEAGFGVDLPKPPGGFNGTTGISYSWRLNEGYFIAGTLERARAIEGSAEFQTETRNLIENVFDEFQRDYFETPVKPSNIIWKDVKQNGHPGIEARFEMPKGLSVIRVFWVKQKAFKIGAMFFEDQLKFEAEAVKVLDTLKAMSAEETEAIVRQKVEESMPTALPQTPSAPKLKSDAEDERLKGKVKAVFYKRQYIKGPKAGTPMQKNSDEYFNEAGNFVKRISYDDTTGFPFQIRVYGYIDGKRVEKSAFVRYGNEIMALRPAKPESKPRDPRYTASFDHQYDSDGRLKEKTVLANDGSVWTKTIYTYKENAVEETAYQDDGKISTKSVSLYDAQGNLGESLYFGFLKVDWQEKSVYSYDEFDKQGNWTKRRTTFYRQKNGAAVEEWVSETYRKIIYY